MREVHRARALASYAVDCVLDFGPTHAHTHTRALLPVVWIQGRDVARERKVNARISEDGDAEEASGGAQR